MPANKVPPGALLLTYGEFAKALNNGTLDTLRGQRSSHCDFCDRPNTRGVNVTYKSKVYCLDCAPDRRRCSLCRKKERLVSFDVLARGNVDSRCRECRRAAHREYYHIAKRTKVRQVPARHTCIVCRHLKAARDFPPDARYVSGLLPRCRQCTTDEAVESRRQRTTRNR